METTMTRYDDVVHAATERIRLRMRRTAEDIIEIGRDLITIKKALPHGQFGEWLRSEFEMTEMTAQRFMQVTERFGGKSNIMLDFKPTVLYFLASPSTPERIVDLATQKTNAGETVTVQEVKDLKRRLKKAETSRQELLKKSDLERQAAVDKINRLNTDLMVLQDRQSRAYQEVANREQDAADRYKAAEALIKRGSVTVEVEKIVEKLVIPEGYSSLEKAIVAKEKELHEKERELKAMEEKRQIIKGQIAQAEFAAKEHEDLIKKHKRILFGGINRAKRFLQDIQEAQLAATAMEYRDAGIMAELAAIRDILFATADVFDKAVKTHTQVVNGEIIQLRNVSPGSFTSAES